jgi:hypothetical protein
MYIALTFKMAAVGSSKSTLHHIGTPQKHITLSEDYFLCHVTDSFESVTGTDYHTIQSR